MSFVQKICLVKAYFLTKQKLKMYSYKSEKGARILFNAQILS